MARPSVRHPRKAARQPHGDRLGPVLAAGAVALCLALGLWPSPAKAERAPLYYHVFVRSFADSDGDHVGDLRGLASKLDYLASLHVTHVLLTPVQASPFYHSYFSTDFDAVDPAYGGEAAWVALVRAAHARGLKVILDEEFQYVAEGHPWWRYNEGRPGGPQGRFLLWNDPVKQTDPEPFLTAPRYRTDDGRMVGIAMVDLNRPEVRAEMQAMLRRHVDPHGDGSLKDGVDGFRLDHMMDDLDGKHRVTHLFTDFWAPTITALKTVNPKLEFVAEQFDWGYGEQFLTRGGADAVFAFPLRAAMVELSKPKLIEALARTAAATPPGKRQLVFLENHDVDRFASLVGSDPRKLRLGALLNLTLGRHAPAQAMTTSGSPGSPAHRVEQLLRPVAAYPGFELAQMLGVFEVGDRHLVGAPGALYGLAVDDLGPGPALGRAEHDHRPAGALHRGVAGAGLRLDPRMRASTVSSVIASSRCTIAGSCPSTKKGSWP